MADRNKESNQTKTLCLLVTSDDNLNCDKIVPRSDLTICWALFVWFVVKRPSQQLWSCGDGQLTQPLPLDQQFNSLLSVLSGPAYVWPGTGVIKLFSCSTKLSTKFQLLIKTKIPTNEEVSCFKSLRCCIHHVKMLNCQQLLAF